MHTHTLPHIVIHSQSHTHNHRFTDTGTNSPTHAHMKEHTLSIVSTIFYLLFLSVSVLRSSLRCGNNSLSFFPFLSFSCPSNLLVSLLPTFFDLLPHLASHLRSSTPRTLPVILPFLPVSSRFASLSDRSSFYFASVSHSVFFSFSWIPPHTHTHTRARIRTQWWHFWVN